MIVYKVIRRGGSSLRSCIAPDSIVAFYKKGMLTHGTVGPILCFDTGNNATLFAMQQLPCPLEIWSCWGLEPHPVDRVVNLGTITAPAFIREFWEGRDIRRFFSNPISVTTPAPRGTIGCRAVMLLEKVA